MSLRLLCLHVLTWVFARAYRVCSRHNRTTPRGKIFDCRHNSPTRRKAKDGRMELGRMRKP
jgi:hypothetical protein